jgi:hypothetical protein
MLSNDALRQITQPGRLLRNRPSSDPCSVDARYPIAQPRRAPPYRDAEVDRRANWFPALAPANRRLWNLTLSVLRFGRQPPTRLRQRNARRAIVSSVDAERPFQSIPRRPAGNKSGCLPTCNNCDEMLPRLHIACGFRKTPVAPVCSGHVVFARPCRLATTCASRNVVQIPLRHHEEPLPAESTTQCLQPRSNAPGVLRELFAPEAPLGTRKTRARQTAVAPSARPILSRRTHAAKAKSDAANDTVRSFTSKGSRRNVASGQFPQLIQTAIIQPGRLGGKAGLPQPAGPHWQAQSQSQVPSGGLRSRVRRRCRTEARSRRSRRETGQAGLPSKCPPRSISALAAEFWVLPETSAAANG